MNISQITPASTEGDVGFAPQENSFLPVYQKLPELSAMEELPTANWNRPQNVIKMRKMKVKKRALQGRLCLESESPKKRAKCRLKKFEIQPPPEDDVTCEDSTLMDLICMQETPPYLNPSLSRSFSASSNSVSLSMSPIRHSEAGDIASLSTLRSYLPTSSILQTPVHLPRKRRQLVPTPVTTTQSPSSALSRKRKSLTFVDIGNVNDSYWSEELCQDWSLKTGVRIVSVEPFNWGSATLKLLEESSGTSAFVRCIDREPISSAFNSSSNNYQLDGSQYIGAQFQQCCLYWQFPYLHEVSVFPRSNKSPLVSLNQSSGTPDSQGSAAYHYDDKALARMHVDWMEAFRSAFQLIRARQSPYFYLSTNQFTCLFTAPGLQANEEIQVSITPSNPSLRRIIINEGIDFSMPYHDGVEYSHESIGANSHEENNGNLNDSLGNDESKTTESDDEHFKWLDDLGVSQDVSYCSHKKPLEAAVRQETNKSSLVVITGKKDTLLLFNLLMNSKQMVVSNVGHLAGISPTILSPVAFVGASLRNLQTKQTKFTDAKGKTWHSLDLQGPVLPHVVHMLSAVMLKTIKDFKMHLSTVPESLLFNFMAAREKPTGVLRPSAFHLQSLSDCGLGKTLLEIFCRCDNVSSVKRSIECENNLFRWK